jgi:hypothetical protein
MDLEGKKIWARARDQVTCTSKLNFENLHYKLISSPSPQRWEPSPACLSRRSDHELDFVSLTLWTRLRVFHRGLDLASTSSGRLSLIRIYQLTPISTTTNTTFLVSHPFLLLFPSPRGYSFFSVVISMWLVPLGILLIPGGRYTHFAWLRTASDTFSCLGTDPWTSAVSLAPLGPWVSRCPGNTTQKYNTLS